MGPRPCCCCKKCCRGSSQPKSLVVQYSSCQYLPTPGFADKAGLRKDNHPASGALARVVHPSAFSTVAPRTSRKLLPRPKSGWGDERRVAHSRAYHSRGLRHQHVTANVRNLCWKNYTWNASTPSFGTDERSRRIYYINTTRTVVIYTFLSPNRQFPAVGPCHFSYISRVLFWICIHLNPYSITDSGDRECAKLFFHSKVTFNSSRVRYAVRLCQMSLSACVVTGIPCSKRRTCHAQHACSQFKALQQRDIFDAKIPRPTCSVWSFRRR